MSCFCGSIEQVMLFRRRDLWCFIANEMMAWDLPIVVAGAFYKPAQVLYNLPDYICLLAHIHASPCRIRQYSPQRRIPSQLSCSSGPASAPREQLQISLIVGHWRQNLAGNQFRARQSAKMDRGHKSLDAWLAVAPARSLVRWREKGRICFLNGVHAGTWLALLASLVTNWGCHQLPLP